MALVAVAVATVAAALAWPRFLDSDPVQEQLRDLVEAGAGRGLDVGGRIGVDLFPRPRLSLARVTLGDRLDLGARARLVADRIDLEVAPFALLAGRLEVHRARVVRPRVTLAAGTPRVALAGGLRALSSPGLEGLDAVQVVDGRVEREPGGAGPARSLAEGIDGTLRRDSLLGRIAVSLTGTAADAPIELDAEVGDADPGTPTSLNLDLAHGAGGHRATLSFRGFGTLSADAGLKGQVELEAAQPADLYRLASVLGPLPPSVRLPRAAPILLDGQLELAQGTLRLTEVTARLGPNTLDAEAVIGLGGRRPTLDLRLSAGEVSADAATADDLGVLAALPGLAATVDGKAEIRFGRVAWRGATLRQARADLGFGPDGLRIDRLAADLPGSAELSVSGTLAPAGDGPRFQGDLSLAAADARETLGAFGIGLDALPEGGLKAVDLHGTVSATASDARLQDFELRLDGARIAGSAALVGGLRPRLALSASADRLDLGLYRPRAGALGGGWLRDRLLGFDAAVDLSADRISLGPVRAGGAYLRASLEQGLVRLAEPSVRDLGEARLRLSGTGDLPVESFQLAGELEAERPARLLRALGLEPPPTLARLPAVRIAGTARGGHDATEVGLSLDAAGAKARLEASLGPWFAAQGARATLDASLDHLADALRGLGVAPADRPSLGRPLRLTTSLVRSDEGDSVAFRAEAAPSLVEGNLTLGGDSDRTVSGDVDGKTLDGDLVATVLALAPAWLGSPPLDLGGVLARPAAGRAARPRDAARPESRPGPAGRAPAARRDPGRSRHGAGRGGPPARRLGPAQGGARGGEPGANPPAGRGRHAERGGDARRAARLRHGRARPPAGGRAGRAAARRARRQAGAHGDGGARRPPDRQRRQPAGDRRQPRGRGRAAPARRQRPRAGGGRPGTPHARPVPGRHLRGRARRRRERASRARDPGPGRLGHRPGPSRPPGLDGGRHGRARGPAARRRQVGRLAPPGTARPAAAGEGRAGTRGPPAAGPEPAARAVIPAGGSLP